ncbi:acetolactate synthase large subunit [Jidongwangia harbinensis]|uniref:acetolactate synthase large subunit n=1 Tax=Jidongwangia harbinensis TaxID=2878561 RepID=UPI001CDA5468|nr:acetolactate synthase large subunit [Jidongwangia harbinensis]MCA2218910.1 acetolactate synthase large subunit [Jidongwangia harbinensis]
MTGADLLVEALLEHGVRVCFGNPGTSEMHFVAALDRYPGMRGVLCLSEGVATGAADGYGRMAGHPAATLLHLGPGLANGLANLHNARRAGTPMLTVVGDHAASHRGLDSPLESDIDALAGTVSAFVHRPAEPAALPRDVAAAVEAAAAGAVATLIVPADVSWADVSWADAVAQPSAAVRGAPAPPRPPAAPPHHVEKVLTSGEPAALLLDGAALTAGGLRAADRIAQVTGARLFCPTWPARLRRGAGVPAVTPLGYRGEDVREQLGDVRHLVLAGARRPVASFAYPGRDGDLVPPGVRVHTLTGSLGELADRIAPGVAARPAERVRHAVPAGPLTARNWAYVIADRLPPEAVVCDESITSGLATLPVAMSGAAAHDVLGLVGLAIGQGLPLAAGAALACPDRPVVCLEADGSAMYTLPALWTHARERLDVTTVVLNNRSYAILRAELDRVGARRSGTGSARMVDLDDPALDFVHLSHGMGVPATRATTTQDLAAQFAAAVAEPGPHLIEAVLTT